MLLEKKDTFIYTFELSLSDKHSYPIHIFLCVTPEVFMEGIGLQFKSGIYGGKKE